MRALVLENLTAKNLHGGCVAGVALATLCLDTTAVAAETQATGQRNFEEVIVTAQKREERLQDVPISMSVLGGDDLDGAADRSVNDAISQVAGVYSFVNGNQGGTKFSVRGVTSNSSNFSGGSTVGYYLDELPFGFVKIPMSPDANAYDLERVEVLRGPQGTLYGVNSLNGVIRVLTRDADLRKFELKGRASASNTDGGGINHGADVAVNVPLVEDRLALRVVAGYQNLSGWIEQPRIARSDVNDSEARTLRVKLNAKPVDDLTIEMMAWLSREDRGGISSGLDNNTRNTVVNEPMTIDYDLYDLNIGYQSSTFSVVSATSYIDFFNTGVLGQTNPLGSFQLTTIPAEVFSQEVRLTSTVESALQWSLGGIYRIAEDRVKADIPGVLNPGIDNIYRSESYAIFGELKYSLLGGLFDITGGLRYFEDRTYVQEKSRINVPNATDLIHTRDDFTQLSPRLALGFHPDEDLDVYASISQGFRSGFGLDSLIISAVPTAEPVDADLLTNYEIGVKGATFNGRLRYDAAVYYIDWKDSKQQVFVQYPGISASFAVPTNSEDITGFGADAGVSVEVAERLNFRVGASWNDLAFSKDVISRATSGPLIIFREGERPDESPELTLGAGADYSVPLGNGFDLGFYASANYSSRVMSHTNTPDSGRPQQALVIKGDDVFEGDLTLSLDSAYGWRLALFVDNVTNENPIVRPTNSATNRNLDARMRPRTIGLQFESEF